MLLRCSWGSDRGFTEVELQGQSGSVCEGCAIIYMLHTFCSPRSHWCLKSHKGTTIWQPVWTQYLTASLFPVIAKNVLWANVNESVRRTGLAPNLTLPCTVKMGLQPISPLSHFLLFLHFYCLFIHLHGPSLSPSLFLFSFRCSVCCYGSCVGQISSTHSTSCGRGTASRQFTSSPRWFSAWPWWAHFHEKTAQALRKNRVQLLGGNVFLWDYMCNFPTFLWAST